jgi:hypothetical protein
MVEEALPRARTENLLVEELAGEVLVYDLENDRAHCLNRTASLIWKNCDGVKRLEELISILENEFTIPVDEAVVWLALKQLKKFRLLQNESVLPAAFARVSRRDLMRKYLPMALALPLITTISTPTAAQTGSLCVNPLTCTLSTQCCPGFICQGLLGEKTCVPEPG